jgi:hypothetical protein
MVAIREIYWSRPQQSATNKRTTINKMRSKQPVGNISFLPPLRQRARSAGSLQRGQPSPQGPANGTLVLILGTEKMDQRTIGLDRLVG